LEADVPTRKIRDKNDILYRPAQILAKSAVLMDAPGLADGKTQWFILDTDIGEISIGVTLTKTKTVE